MPFFRREKSPHRASPGTKTRHHQKAVHDPLPMSRRPTFGQWLKGTWLDIVTMACMGAIGLGVYFAKPAPARSFPVTFSDGEIVWPEYGYPLRGEIIPIWAAAMLAALVPIFVFLVMQIRIRSFWDVNNAVIGLLYSLITAAVFQVFVKWLIGGFRPHFLEVCKPDMARARTMGGYNNKGYLQLYYTPDICTGDKSEINDALESMPSGHTTAAFAGFVYLYLYLNAKLKVFSNYHPSMWKLIVTYAPLLGAVLIGGALTIDKYHHFHDVLAGAIIGTVFAFSAYRMTYAAVWDWRFNHIPLNRGAPFNYSMSGAELVDAVFTRKVGWGSHGGSSLGHGHGHGLKSDGSEHMHGNGYNNGSIPRRPVGTGARGEEMV
ncbi:diacylglycerol pyrophosphate phosphatase DPP1 [Fusarium acutatum]|uniref:Diacylglycerol pyrophosphate phosphatase DPP1 n=1 Tax=Fusarium acutatum TaxID=78861 RepID=A0A8H4JJR6_9HYPO|nr:diacylglycerol pyrophosphate phosphatase DPP1 [Fusarium acutatum]